MQSEDNFSPVKPKHIRKIISKEEMHTHDYINVQSGDGLSNADYMIKDPVHPSMAHHERNKKKLTLTAGTMSEVSTTVMAPSQQRGLKQSSLGMNNFAELGVGLVNDTPRSKQSHGVRLAYKKPDRPYTLVKNKTSGASKAHLGDGDGKRRNSLMRSYSKQGMRHKASSRNLLNPGGLTHFNFI